MTAVSAEVSGTRGAPSGNPDVPEAGQLVRVRGQQWVVSLVNNSHRPQDELAATRLPGRTLVTLTSVSDDDLGDELTVALPVPSLIVLAGDQTAPGFPASHDRSAARGHPSRPGDPCSQHRRKPTVWILVRGGTLSAAEAGISTAGGHAYSCALGGRRHAEVRIAIWAAIWRRTESPMWRGPAALGLAAVVDSQKKYPVARVP